MNEEEGDGASRNSDNSLDYPRTRMAERLIRSCDAALSLITAAELVFGSTRPLLTARGLVLLIRLVAVRLGRTSS
jgi:hypothetical protein